MSKLRDKRATLIQVCTANHLKKGVASVLKLRTGVGIKNDSKQLIEIPSPYERSMITLANIIKTSNTPPGPAFISDCPHVQTNQ